MPCIEDRPRATTAAHHWFFNSDAFHRHNGVLGDVVRVDHHEGDRLVGSLTGVVHDGCWTSGFSAPYGGIDVVRPGEAVANIAALAHAARIVLAARGIGQLRVRCRPQAYGRIERAATFALIDAGFAVERCHVSHHIDIPGVADLDGYLAALSASARNMVKKGAELGLGFTEADTTKDWTAGYDVLRANKEAKGRPMWLSLDYLLGLRDAAPGVLRLVALAPAVGPPCAAALTYRVGPGVELVVAWGDARHDLPRSPMNLLALRLVERALVEGTKVLDLGISSDGDGRLNPGLAFFKESVGATADLRFDLITQEHGR